MGNSRGAYGSYQTARERLEALRSILWGEDLKIAFMTTKLEVYERLVDLCMRRDDGEGDRVGDFRLHRAGEVTKSARSLFRTGADRSGGRWPE